MSEPVRALLVTRNFPPLRGGMERLNQRMAAALAARGALALVGPRGCTPHAPPAATVVERPLTPLPAFLLRAGWAALRLARRLRPRTVLAGSGLTAPLARLAAAVSGARCIVYLHGLDIVVRDPVYRALWLPCIRGCALALVNSRNTRALAIAAGLPAERVVVIHPGTDLPVLDADAGARWRTAHAFGDRPVLLSVGRLTTRKGMAEFVADVLPAIVAQVPDVLLVVIGDDAADALHAGPAGGSARVAAAARAAGVDDAVRLLGPCDDATLGAAYQGADLHVFPVREQVGDVEGFGMVAIEAAAHGLATVAYAVGGVPDAVCDGRNGRLVAAGDAPAFAQAAIELLPAARAGALRASAREFAAGFSWPRFAQELDAALARVER